MTHSNADLRSVIRLPGAFLPVAMSLTALALVLGHVALYGAGREADEGAVAHSFQILIAAQVPVMAWFVIRCLPRAPRETLLVLGLQVVAIVAALTPVFLLHL